MEKIKVIIAIAASFILGPLLTYHGWKDYTESAELVARHELVTGRVTGANKTPKKNGWNYNLQVAFQTKAGEAISKAFPVEEEIYTAASTNPAIAVYYHPGRTSLAVVGTPPSRTYRTMLTGVAMVLGGVFLIWYTFRPPEKRAASAIAKSMAQTYVPRHDYGPADPKDFTNLDLAFYNQTQQVLEQNGFTHVCDEENLTISRKGIRTFLRVMLSPDRTTSSAIYNVQPKWLQRIQGAPSIKVMDLETEFSDGTFVCLHNSEQAAKMDSPPQITTICLRASTAPAEMIRAHAAAVIKHLAAQPERQALAMDGHAGIRNMQDRMQKIKSAFRQQVGLTKKELERIAGPGADHAALDEVHRNLQREQQKDRQT